MSSTETLGSSCLWALSTNKTADVETPISHTRGRVTEAKTCITGAAKRATSSARRNANRFGTSSPKSNVQKESNATNVVRATDSATG